MAARSRQRAAATGQSNRSQLCTRLEGAARGDRPRRGADPARAEQVRRYEEAAGKQQAELDRMVAQSRRAGCEGTGFFLFGALQSQSQQCATSTADLEHARQSRPHQCRPAAAARRRYDRGEQRRSVMVALAQNNCGPQYRQAARAPGGIFDQLFGRDSETTPSGDLANPDAQSGSFRTVCVRTCDGFYFPISYATSRPLRAGREDLPAHVSGIRSDAVLHRTTGEDITQATSINGRPTRRCRMRSSIAPNSTPPAAASGAGQSWADALGKDEAVEPGDIVVTEERAKQLSAAAAAEGADQRPQPAANPAAATPAAPAPAEAPPPATAETEPGKRPVRAVGPTFIPAR